MLTFFFCFHSKAQELEKFVDVAGSECLNEHKDHRLANIFKTERNNVPFGSCLKSDTDAQLLFTVHFNQAVKIQSFKITAPSNGTC